MQRLLMLLIFFIVAGINPQCCRAQDTLKKGIDTTAVIPKPNPWIEKKSQYIILKLTESSDVQMLGVLTDSSDIQLSPYAKLVTVLGFSYRFLSFSISYIPKFIPGNNQSNIYGNTSIFGLGTSFQFANWRQELSYNKIKGYYLINTQDYDPDWKPGEPHMQFPDLSFQSFQGATYYKLNRKFSLSALTSQTERQTKSAGSVIAGLLYRYYIVDNTAPIAPTSNAERTRNIEFILGLGYSHTLVLKKSFYISLGVAPGGGYVFTKLFTHYPDRDEIDYQQSPIFRLDLNAGMGYNGDRFFTGLYYSSFTSSSGPDEASVIDYNARTAIRIFIGYRFGAPRLIKQPFDYAEKTIEEQQEKIPFLKKKKKD